jgi:hypothetical protein
MVEFVTNRELDRKPSHKGSAPIPRVDPDALTTTARRRLRQHQEDRERPRLDSTPGAGVNVDWKQVALDAWHAPSWREAAVEYHRDRPPTPRLSPDDKLTPSPREIWRAAGQCIRRKAPHHALRTFLRWCDYSGVDRGAALPIFKAIVEKELAK